MTAPHIPKQTETGLDIPLRRISDDGSLARWISPVLVVVALVILLMFRGPDASGQIPLTVRWLLAAVLAITAWTCPSRFTIAVSLVAILTWSWIEIGAGGWHDVLPGHLVRLFVSMVMITWVIRAREQLATAQKLARIDNLTGLPNRQALIEAIERELSRAKRFGRPFSLAMLDCDGFKQLNDQRGHLAGDDALVLVGESLRQNVRPFDCAGRWGGDEFLIVLSEVDYDDAQMIAERLRASVRHFVERGLPSLTFSLGVLIVRQPEMGWQECVRQADQAMYEAKRAGRDQTRFVIAPADYQTSQSDSTSDRQQDIGP